LGVVLGERARELAVSVRGSLEWSRCVVGAARLVMAVSGVVGGSARDVVREWRMRCVVDGYEDAMKGMKEECVVSARGRAMVVVLMWLAGGRDAGRAVVRYVWR
jgi:hypothetical protein